MEYTTWLRNESNRRRLEGPHALHNCSDCVVNTSGNPEYHGINEYYMVRDSLWEAANQENYAYILCIGCLEKRLGRRLEPQDFTDCPLNKAPTQPRSYRLRNRMGKHNKKEYR